MWYLSQLSRREHYALPGYLHEQGKLGLFVTDIWCASAERIPYGLMPEKLAQRYNPALKGATIVSQGLLNAFCNRFSREEQSRRWVREGRQFGVFAASKFARTSIGAGDVLLGFTAANLEPLKLAKARGATGLHVQVDPGLDWYLIRQAEQRAFPYVEDEARIPDGSFFDRVRSEWEHASRVIVHSEHSKQALARQGVGEGKCIVASPAFSPISGSQPKIRKPGQPLRALFVGNHCLAKGFHYFVQAAKSAQPGIEFHSAGRITLKDAYRKEADKYVRIHGPLDQAAVWQLMAASDVLVFPTLSDGFGLVQLEAMSLGLPVISTPDCGEVVRDGIDGFKVPARDSAAINEALTRLLEQPDLQTAMSSAALIRSCGFSPAVQFAQIVKCLRNESRLDSPETR
jgi:glycosyltransferase involved in cell wall biosynthesis